jgi:hypothetical protein
MRHLAVNDDQEMRCVCGTRRLNIADGGGHVNVIGDLDLHVLA